MAQTWNKRERELKKQQNKKDKEVRKLERKKNSAEGNKADMILAYVDENGNLTSTPPDPSKRKLINAEDIEIKVMHQNIDNETDAIKTGIVLHFNNLKGYGFIKDLQSQKEYFVHINGLIDRVAERSKVHFVLEAGPKGWSATKVKLVK